MRSATAVRVLVSLGIAAVVAAGSTGPAAAATVQRQTRDPLRWPFARTSIWNTPIGTRASYVPAGLSGAGFGVAVDWFVVTRAKDPAVPVLPPNAAGADPCPGQVQQQHGSERHGSEQHRSEQHGSEQHRSEHLPRSFVLGGADTTAAFLEPDGRTIVSYGLVARCTPGGPLHGRWAGAASLFGNGIVSGRAGAGLSGVGGSIRTDELTSRTPIRHALRLDVSHRYLFSDTATGATRWPAVRASGGHDQRGTGSVRALRIGALLALPPGVTAAGLGVRSAVGRKLLAALRDYGAYVAGDTSADGVDLWVEHRAAVDFAERRGHAVEADSPLAADVSRMLAALAVVDDNAPGSIGGSGARRAPWAPPFRAAPAPGATSTAATRPPAASAIKTTQVVEVEHPDRAPGPVLWALVVVALGMFVLGVRGGRRLARTARGGDRARTGEA